MELVPCHIRQVLRYSQPGWARAFAGAPAVLASALSRECTTPAVVWWSWALLIAGGLFAFGFVVGRHTGQAIIVPVNIASDNATIISVDSRSELTASQASALAQLCDLPRVGSSPSYVQDELANRGRHIRLRGLQRARGALA